MVKRLHKALEMQLTTKLFLALDEILALHGCNDANNESKVEQCVY